MIEVNDYFVGVLLEVFAGFDSDYTEEDLLKIEPDDYSEIDKILLDKVRPYYHEFSLDSQSKIKNSLKWLLNVGHESVLSDSNEIIGNRFEQVFASNLFAIDLPSNPKDFYVHLWSVLFDSESFQIEDVRRYQFRDDDNFVNSLVGR